MTENNFPTCMVTVRDNQWWFSKSKLRDHVQMGQRIRLRIGNRLCEMTRSRPGSDGRPTHSFTFDSSDDRRYWRSLSKQEVQLVLESVDDQTPANLPAADIGPVEKKKAEKRTSASKRSDVAFPPAEWKLDDDCQYVLCIGVDLAWFGGKARNRASQFDILAYAIVDRKNKTCEQLHYQRVSLSSRRDYDDPHANCDSDAALLHGAIAQLVTEHDRKIRVVALCIDAPLVAESNETCELRLKKAQEGVERRACENTLGDACRGIGANWIPKIQPGRPLCKRVVRLLEKLKGSNFTVFPEHSEKVVFECYPAEAIWAGFAQSTERNYKAYVKSGVALPDASAVQAYKRTKAPKLSFSQYAKCVADALTIINTSTGLAPKCWNQLVSQVISGLAKDPDYVDSRTGIGRGGKLLDDVVDATFSLAAAISFALGNAHVWMVDQGQDGHIIGPGR